MNANESLARVMCELLEDGSPLVLASIVEVQGSAPRHPGARMVLGPNGKSYGTIGGSLLEHVAIQEAECALIERRSKLLDSTLDGSPASGGMMCGGKTVVLLDYIPATPDNVELFRCWHAAVSTGKSFYFLTQVGDTDNSIGVLGHSLLFPDGTIVGQSRSPVSQLEDLGAEARNISTTTVFEMGDTRIIVDPVRNLKSLYCFGAGHVAVPTARIAAMAGFRVTVVDDRPEFANVERFPDAEQICVIQDFDRALEGLEIGPDSFVVIMTYGHQYDRAVLAQALKTKAYYIGMISSSRKRNTIFQSFLAEGVSEKELKRVHSPIGMDIGSETPEEIAVSIVAELIRERARQPA